MALITIGRANKFDPFYRYKMPDLVIKIEGIKTRIVNIEQIAKALSRESYELMKYFAYELGTNVKDNALNGTFSHNDLSNLLSLYIDTFVLCYNCENPETKYIVMKQKLGMSCKACGNISEVTSQHKIMKIIVKSIQPTQPCKMF